MRISKLTLILDGEEITDFSKFKENEVESTVRVPLHNSEDVAESTPSHGFSVTFLPGSGADRNWNGIRGVTAIAQYKGGAKVVFGDCSVLKYTPNDMDGKTAKECVVEWFAKTRKQS